MCNAAKQTSGPPERHTETTLEIRMTALEAQMSIMKEKIELQNMLQELKEERRQIKISPAESYMGTPTQDPMRQPDMRPPNKTTIQAGQTQEDTDDTQNAIQHFLSHGRASTNTHHQLTQLQVQRNQGQPLFMQQTRIHNVQLPMHTAPLKQPMLQHPNIQHK